MSGAKVKGAAAPKAAAGKSSEGATTSKTPWIDRPARKQVGPEFWSREVNRSNLLENYNIWYHKSANFEQSLPEPRKTRCDVKRDTGFTKANSTGMLRLCMMFAHGCCPHGHECKFLHRIPLSTDREDPSADCFGRERYGTDRQDMGGVGTFSRENTTLYIGGVVAGDRPAEQMLFERYSQFGEIVSIKVLKVKPVGFVKFKRRSNAEFAREATQNMIWETGEMFNVRWATEDPNPKARREFLEDARDRMVDALKAKVGPGMMEQYVMIAQAEMKAEGQVGVHGKNVRPTDVYPTTEAQDSQSMAGYQGYPQDPNAQQDQYAGYQGYSQDPNYAGYTHDPMYYGYSQDPAYAAHQDAQNAQYQYQDWGQYWQGQAQWQEQPAAAADEGEKEETTAKRKRAEEEWTGSKHTKEDSAAPGEKGPSKQAALALVGEYDSGEEEAESDAGKKGEEN